ncbi:hypothetical protein [Mucilaginibacter auburnensis]|uniref:Uncharacterized protein n=1 Tax=Mucilaginibacter auburnensis TaxID=1457233 RepID=A0A2H9VNN8_9SPHI|nr:hypothetical protein [Mucilaginibacter auburnensis]PJJ79958.1 hypothetical protein CLV57_3097 [Mucilaginibacter auburnensis]
MPIRNQIEAIVQSLTNSPAFAYGTTNELNTLADDITTFPCVFMYPVQPIELSPHVNSSVSNTFTLTLEFLFKTEFDQYTADNETYVSQALKLANELIVKASTYRESEGRYFKIKTGTKARCLPVYNKFDANTTGVSLTITLTAMYFQNF